MKTRDTWTSLAVSKRAARAVAVGHPWVYREGEAIPAAGTPVRLVSGGRDVGWGLADEGPITVRVLGRGSPPSQALSAVIATRVRQADAFRWRLFDDQTDCWRMVNGAGDGLPGLVMDRYGGLVVLRIYSEAWLAHLDSVVSTIAALGWVTTIYRRLGVTRVDGETGGHTLWGDPVPESLVVTEHGMRMLVRPQVGQKTGLFLDQRAHRALVRRHAAGRRVANLFAYNGGFSVAAALGGAAVVTTVDIAPEAVADAREIFRLNGIDPDDHQFEVADAFAWTPRSPLDLLVVDPPSLARGKQAEQAAERAYRNLHAGLGPHVAHDGLLATASCTARLGLERWREAVSSGLRDTGDWSWHWTSTEPPDHPVALAHSEAHYLKFALLRRR